MYLHNWLRLITNSSSDHHALLNATPTAILTAKGSWLKANVCIVASTSGLGVRTSPGRSSGTGLRHRAQPSVQVEVHFKSRVFDGGWGVAGAWCSPDRAGVPVF